MDRRIILTVGDTVLDATLADNETARDFASLLPLTVPMGDLGGREKYGPLPRSLAAGGQPRSSFDVGLIGYWSPGTEVAIYYADDGVTIPAPGIVPLGTIDSGSEVLREFNVPFEITIEAA